MFATSKDNNLFLVKLSKYLFYGFQTKASNKRGKPKTIYIFGDRWKKLSIGLIFFKEEKMKKTTYLTYGITIYTTVGLGMKFVLGRSGISLLAILAPLFCYLAFKVFLFAIFGYSIKRLSAFDDDFKKDFEKAVNDLKERRGR
jgi:hypothetical protein